MLDYAKTVLEKVSFDKELFHKELSKFMLLLSPSEANKLFAWCFSNYKIHFENSRYQEYIPQ